MLLSISLLNIITYIHYCKVKQVLQGTVFLRVRKEKTYRDFMKMYSLSIQQELRRAIGKNNMFVLAKQSHQHQQGDVSKGITLKSNKCIVTKMILKEVRTAISATNGPFWADQAV